MTASILPIPPLSIPTFLQLELDAEEPSQLYIHRPASTDIPYESSAVKFERLENFLLLPGHLEGTLLLRNRELEVLMSRSIYADIPSKQAIQIHGLAYMVAKDA